MAVSLRLTRMGANKKPFYRIVAVDSRIKRDGKYIELIGFYNPLTGEKKVRTDLALKWLQNGAKPSDTVKSIFSEKKILEEFEKIKALKMQEKKSTSKLKNGEK